MQVYCTLFDSFYLSRGLAMYNSLKKHCPSFHLYVFAFDDLCLKILNDKQLDNLTVISPHEFENEELLKIKPTRSRAEYCWTCTSSTIEYVLSNFNVRHCTYIDADLYFYGNPEVLEGEMQPDESVLITEHRYSKLAELYEAKRAGRFCVQYITFKNNDEGRKVLGSWKEQCLEWCYDRYEDGKFGDQKYLDYWPDKYNGIHILENHGGGLAPWNVQQYNFDLSDNTYLLRSKRNDKSYKLIFYHFHFVRFMNSNDVDIGWHKLPKSVIKNIYLPYINELLKIENGLNKDYPEYKTRYQSMNKKGIKNLLKYVLKNVTKFNIVPVK